MYNYIAMWIRIIFIFLMFAALVAVIFLLEKN